MRTPAIVLLLLPACVDTAFVAATMSGPRRLAGKLRVEPLYEAAPDWNDYLQLSAPAAPHTAQPDVTCEIDLRGTYAQCLHGAEYRWVGVDGLDRCQGLVMQDSAGAFDWRCVTSNRGLGFAGALRSAVGLADLLEGDRGFRPLSVSLYDGAEELGRSEPATWWDNPVSALPQNGADGGGQVVLADAGAVYVFDGDRASHGYVIAAPRIALIGLGGTLRGHPDLPPATPLILVDGVPHAWLEGAFALDPGGGAVLALDGSHLSRVHQAHVSGGGVGTASLLLDECVGTRVTRVHVTDSANSCMVAQTDSNWAGGTYIGRSTFDRCVGFGVELKLGTHDNVVVGSAIHATNSGLKTRGQTRVALTTVTGASYRSIVDGGASGSFEGLGLILAGGLGLGLETTDTGQELRHSAILDHRAEGLLVRYGDTVFTDLLILDNVLGLRSVGVGGIAVKTFENLVVAHNDIAIEVQNKERFLGQLYVGGPGFTCTVVAGGDPGLSTYSCDMAGESTAALHLDTDVSGMVVGKASADARNATAGVGDRAVSEASAISDWFGFDNPWRFWGLEGSAALFASDQRGICEGNALCRIYDLSLTAADDIARNVRPPLVDGAPCPADVHGDRVDLRGDALVHAYEILDDHLGNEDGFCQSHEACVYAPNIGPYQGHGDYTRRRCRFQDGAVQGVQMFGYSENGR